MNRMTKYLFLFLLLFVGPSVGWALDNATLLDKGSAALDAGQLDRAVDYFTEYLGQQPITTGNTSRYHRDALAAYSGLLKVLKRQNASDSITQWLQRLKNDVKQVHFDPKNSYRLGLLYYTYQF